MPSLIGRYNRKISELEKINALKEIDKRVKDAQKLAQNQSYGEAIKMLKLISKELESKPILKSSFGYLPSLILRYNKSISDQLQTKPKVETGNKVKNEQSNSEKNKTKVIKEIRNSVKNAQNNSFQLLEKAKIEKTKLVKDAQKLAKNKNYGEAVKILDLLSQELESRPKLKNHFGYLPSLILRYNKSRDIQLCKQAMPVINKRCTSNFQKLSDPTWSGGRGVTNMKIDIGLKLIKTCKEEHQVWLSELDSNLEEKSVKLDTSVEACITLKKTKNKYIRANPFDERAQLRYVCYMKLLEWKKRNGSFSSSKLALKELLAPSQTYQALTPSQHRNLKTTKKYFKKVIRLERDQIQKFDQDMEEYEININQCPKVFEVRALYVKNLEEAVALDKQNQDNIRKKKDKQAAKTASFNAAIEELYKIGLFKKFTTDDLKEEEEDRKSSMVKAGLNYQAWLKGNKEFELSHSNKVKIFGQWETIYQNYMWVSFCEKNQGKFALIDDMGELKNKMKVINMMLPLQIDPDVLWTTAEDNNTMKVVNKMDGVLSAEEFIHRFGKYCKNFQRLVRLTYNVMTKTLAEKKRKKTKRNF